MWPAICKILNETYGANYNGHAYKYDFFSQMIRFLPDKPSLDYLEIGSYEGVSLLTVTMLLRSVGKLGRIVSVDPYFPEGYFETPPGQARLWKNATSETLERVRRLYKAADLNVDIIRSISADALSEQLRSGARFDLAFVDGNHEGMNPMIDTVLSLLLLKPGGLLCLDDVGWPSVKPVAEICAGSLEIAFRNKSHVAYVRK